MLGYIRESIEKSVRVKNRLLHDDSALNTVSRMAEKLVYVYEGGRKTLIAGNGGSAADAQHFAAEITCQFLAKRKARPALALHCDTSALTAWGNDHSFTSAFARQVEAHGCAGDVLVVISTSGNSGNLVEAAEMAHTRGLFVFGLLGRDGGELHKRRLCDEAIIVPSDETPHIQECHIMLIHILCDFLDQHFVLADSVDFLHGT